MTALAGEIYWHDKFYADEKSGELLPKYLIVLAVPSKDDVVYRLLTSQDYGRSRNPLCDHVGSYPGFYLGAGICEKLHLDTWIDLRRRPDYDSVDFAAGIKANNIRLIHVLPAAAHREACLCAASAEDTTGHQAKRIMDALS